MAVVGTGGTVSVLTTIARYSDEDSEVGGADLAWILVPAIFNFLAMLMMAYTKVMQPREKQAQYSAASGACATVSTVAKVSTRADLGGAEDKTLVLSNLLSATLTTLEATALDDQPPLSGDKKKKQ
jgi:hypothetical protein